MTTTGDVPVRLLAAAGALLAVVPVGAYLLWEASPSVVLALMNVALIAGSLYLLFGPTDESHEHATESAP